jgi:hypothetical protein
MKKILIATLVIFAIIFLYKNYTVNNNPKELPKNIVQEETLEEKIFNKYRNIYYPEGSTFYEDMQGPVARDYIKTYYKNQDIIMAGFLVKGGYAIGLYSVTNLEKLNTVNFNSSGDQTYQDDKYFIAPDDQGVVYYKYGEKDFTLVKNSEILDRAGQTYISNIGNITNRQAV